MRTGCEGGKGKGCCNILYVYSIVGFRGLGFLLIAVSFADIWLKDSIIVVYIAMWLNVTYCRLSENYEVFKESRIIYKFYHLPYTGTLYTR